MSISSQEHVKVPVNDSSPIPAENGNGNKIHLEHVSPSAELQLRFDASIRSSPEDIRPRKKAVKYMECLKNHAAAIGGHATDGCGEFMPGGAEGSIEALKCSACSCHRNFHKKVPEGDRYSCTSQCHHLHSLVINNNAERKVKLGPENSKAEENQVKFLSKKIELQSSETDEPIEVGRKRCRTRFTQEQKEKMLCFAEKVEWKIQKLDDNFVHRFCQEIGIKRSVLKVWMHNNKHNLAKKSLSAS